MTMFRAEIHFGPFACPHQIHYDECGNQPWRWLTKKVNHDEQDGRIQSGRNPLSAHW
jgi:hypothetical protein